MSDAVVASTQEVAGLDYSTKAVHAAIVGNRQLRFVQQYALAAVPEDNLHTLDRVAADLLERGVTQAWLEQPFFNPRISNAGTLKLHRAASRLEAMLQLRGIAVNYVAPATWKSRVLTHALGYSTKDQSRWFVRQAYGYETGDDNAADAICIATYGADVERTHRLAGGVR